MSAAHLAVDIEKSYGTFRLNITLTAEPGVLVLFGASGAGKTTVLNAIAGLARPDRGSIRTGGETWFSRGRPGPSIDLPARVRRVGYVLQDYALFPHMTALENVRFPVRRREDGEARARSLLERVSMGHLGDRRPNQLSGGQQQRVAIARALAGDSHVLLLDEPFGALDAPVRERLQRDLRSLQREMGLIVVLVTHRLEDAFAMGDVIAILRGGTIEQIGPIADVFHRPATRSVAEIMGIRNLLRARVASAGATTTLDWDGILLEAPADPSLAEAEDVTAYVRPDDIKIVYPDRPISRQVSHNLLDATILVARQNASSRLLRIELTNGHELEVRFPALSYAELPLEPGNAVRIAVRRDGIVLLGRLPG
jgi:molybdate transport system ATP-binding protein